jgi:hypothetical protein
MAKPRIASTTPASMPENRGRDGAGSIGVSLWRAAMGYEPPSAASTTWDGPSVSNAEGPKPSRAGAPDPELGLLALLHFSIVGPSRLANAPVE